MYRHVELTNAQLCGIKIKLYGMVDNDTELAPPPKINDLHVISLCDNV